MTKEEITKEQAMQYLEMLVALDNTQIAKDTLEYFKKIQQENQKQKKKIDLLKSYMFVNDAGSLTNNSDKEVIDVNLISREKNEENDEPKELLENDR